MIRKRTERLIVTKVTADRVQRVPDELIVEEPMTIQLDGTVVSTTMRTPGNDYELAVGFCHTEGLLGDAPVKAVRYCATGAASDAEFNVVTVETGGRAPTPTPRLGVTSSSCGWCGSDQLDDMCGRLAPLAAQPLMSLEMLASMPQRVAETQELFAATGAVHAAAAFDGDGNVLLTREDVGRHNAVDKVIGAMLLAGRAPGQRPWALRERPGERRDGPEGVGRRVRHGRRRQCADVARRASGAAGQPRARRVRPR